MSLSLRRDGRWWFIEKTNVIHNAAGLEPVALPSPRRAPSSLLAHLAWYANIMSKVAMTISQRSFQLRRRAWRLTYPRKYDVQRAT